jgi:hypothetical protein
MLICALTNLLYVYFTMVYQHPLFYSWWVGGGYGRSGEGGIDVDLAT